MTDPIARLNAALEGRYRIEDEIGRGGMATVYLAEDVRHERNVALKVLKPELAAVVGAERFLTEIKTTANLKHPHILPLHDSGEADGFLFFVMPFMEGESLRDRIDREKQLPVDDAVAIASKVAGALQHAHEHGVIHRDIKPGNILFQDGEPVVADFGIALAAGVAGGARLTETGLSVGTPYYMSPEQATGDQDVGPATDTYSLACVLFETLVGEPPYLGNTAQAVLGKIIQGQPISPTAHRRSIPANVDAAIRKALEKLPADRFTGAQEFAKALADPGFRHGEPAAASAGPARGLWHPLQIVTTAVAVLAVALAAWSLLRPEPPASIARFSSPFEAGQEPTLLMEYTSDGSALVYQGPGDGGIQLWIRRWSDLEATPIRDTQGGGTFTLSPDGREVAIAGGGGEALRVVPLDGGPTRTLLESTELGVVSDWGADGMVYFSTTLGQARIPSSGGGNDAVETVTEVGDGEFAHGELQILPGGKMAVFRVLRSLTGVDSEIWAVDLESGERSFLTAGVTPRYSPTGHLLFGTPDGVLMAAPFDPARAEIRGRAVPVAEGLLVVQPFALILYAVSSAGELIYSTGGPVELAIGIPVEFEWVSRAGVGQPVGSGLRLNLPTGNFGWRLSPDGTRLAVSRLVDGNTDIWITELPDGPLERLTFDDTAETYPVWSEDGERVTYLALVEGGDYDVWERPADGTGSPQLLVDDERGLLQTRIGPDREWMVFRTAAAAPNLGDRDIVGFQPGGDGTVQDLVATEFQEQDPALSPNGRWLAYTSIETGELEVYVRPFPDVESGRVRVSTGGGLHPVWAHSGEELFFVDATQNMIAARVATEPEFRVLERQTLFSLETGGNPYLTNSGSDFYDVSPDDQQFLLGRVDLSLGDEGGGRHVLVQNFYEVLREVGED